jgi:dienelactone hydrolase
LTRESPLPVPYSDLTVNSQFCAHPSGISQKMVLDALTTFNVPYSMAVGDKDFVFKPDQVSATKAEAKEKVGAAEEHDYEIKTYEGCVHGFAVRALPGNEVETVAAEDAAKQAAAWFNKYLN